MSITRYLGQPLPIVLVFPDNPLTVYGKDYSDITEISMNLKQNLAIDDDDAYLERTRTDTGVTLDEANHRFIMDMSDYGNLKVDSYHLVLGIKVAGFTQMIEPTIEDDKVVITIDKNRA